MTRSRTAAGGLAWQKTVAGRLFLLAAAVIVLGGSLVFVNLRASSALREQLEWIDEAGQLRRDSAQMLYLAQRLETARGEDRRRVRADLRLSVEGFEARLARLSADAPAVGLDEVRARWRLEVRPALVRWARHPDPGQLEAVRRLLGTQSAQASRLVEAAIEIDRRDSERAQVIEILLLCLVAMIIGLGLVLTHRLARRTRRLVEVANAMATGSHAVRAPQDGDDELAVIGAALNRVERSLRETIDREIDARARLGALVTEVRSAVDAIAGSSQRMVTSAQTLTQRASQQSGHVLDVTTAVLEASRASEAAKRRAVEVADAAIRSHSTARSGRDAVSAIGGGMERVRELAEQGVEALLALADRAETVGEVVASVDDLASRTQMVALNSKILAARAGEHGRGFAVLAQEIAALAVRSREATVRAREILEEIRVASLAGVSRSRETRDAVYEAMKTIGRADKTIDGLTDALTVSSQLATQILASIREHTTGMGNLQHSMREIDETTKDNLVSAQSTDAEARELDGLASHLQQLLAS
ncbi:MAG: methyl-accepting chemotaxis protein [Sandaracinaceae bacterium]